MVNAWRSALRNMPKAELHLHIEGTLEPELALRLARRNRMSLPWTSIDDLKRQYAFSNLQSFLDLYYRLMAVLTTEDDFRDLMLAYLHRASQDGVRHAEIFFDPQIHIRNGSGLNTVMDGLLEGLRLGHERYGISGGLILSIVRDMPVESAERLLDEAEHRTEDLVGIGLDSAEVGYPPSLFSHVYDRATAMGLHRVAHAGEEGPAEYIHETLDVLHVERIDHGIRAIDDPQLMSRLADEGIVLDICPLSNRRLQVVNDLHELPLREFLEAGVPVTINSDDPAYFGGYIGANYIALAETGYSLEALAATAHNSIQASFLDDAAKRRLFDELGRWKTRYLPIHV